MASIIANGSKGHHKFTLNVVENSTSTADNTSSVSFSFVLSPIQTTWNWEGWGAYISYSININGSVYTGTIPNYDGYATVTLKSETLNIGHNADGKKSISFSFSVTDTSGQSYTCGNASGSGSMNLTNIPRYANITGFYVTAEDETTLKFHWSADAECDFVWFSTDDGANWGQLSDHQLVGSLSSGTEYKCRIRIRRKDSQLLTVSDTYRQSTYHYPHCTNSHNFTIGDALTLDFYNPLSRNISVKGYAKTDNREIFSGVTNGTRLVGFNDSNSVNYQYASIPNSQSGEYRVVVSYNGVDMTRDAGNTYQVRGNETPTINGFDYIDNNEKVVAITENNQHIVQNKSELLARFHAATPNYGASNISQYSLECNGKTANGDKEGAYSLGTIDSARDVELKLTAVDSRGLSASRIINVTMIPHNDPTAIVTLKRLNNYEDKTDLIVDGSVSSVNGKNTMAIKYRYKVSGGNYNSFVTVGDNAKQTFTLDKNSVFIFNIVVTDAFGSTYDKEHTLGKGVFPLFIDTEKNSVGINCFPKYENSLEINETLPPVATSVDSLSSYDDIEGDLKRSGFYTCGQGNTWCNLINLRHRNGEGDGKHYGLQIRNTMLTKQSKLEVRNHDAQGWGNWRWIQEEGVFLFESETGENSTVYLSESVGNFSYIEIFYSLKTSGVDYFSSVRVHSPQGKNVFLFSALPNGQLIIGMGTVTLDGNRITFTTNSTYAYGNWSSPVTGDEMHIFRVLGYR